MDNVTDFKVVYNYMDQRLYIMQHTMLYNGSGIYEIGVRDMRNQDSHYTKVVLEKVWFHCIVGRNDVLWLVSIVSEEACNMYDCGGNTTIVKQQ